jgi:hypothetical protein
VKFEDILPKIRKGRKARRAVWLSALFHKDSSLGLKQSDILSDDWELVPEPRKHKVTVCLWSDGVARFHGDVFTLNPGDHIVEVKEIEWEMPE